MFANFAVDLTVKFIFDLVVCFTVNFTVNSKVKSIFDFPANFTVIYTMNSANKFNRVSPWTY